VKGENGTGPRDDATGKTKQQEAQGDGAADVQVDHITTEFRQKPQHLNGVSRIVHTVTAVPRNRVRLMTSQ